MPGKRVFLRTNAVKTVFPQNEKLLFSNEKLNLTALSAFFGPEPDLFRCVFSSRVEWHHRNARRTRFSAN